MKKKTIVEPDEINSIGRGSYGCIFDGELKCRDDDKSRCENKQCISKRFYNPSSYENEFIQSSKAEAIDQDGKYHFKILGKCDHSAKYRVPKHCLTFDNDPPLIYYEKGEKSLYNILTEIHDKSSINILEYRDLLINIQNLFDGIVYFASHNFIHHDIKSENIEIGRAHV